MIYMKRTILLQVLLGIALASSSQIIKPHCYYLLEYKSGAYPCESYDDWVLVFEDQFSGTEVNDQLWRNSYPWGRNLYCAGQKTYYSDGDNFDFDNGKLILIADDDPVYERVIDDWSDSRILYCGDDSTGVNKRWFDYTSGMIFSKQSFLYGKFEIKCKIPAIKRLRPAFWLYGDCDQEIDVFEFMSESSNPATASEQITFTYHRKLSCSDENKVSCIDDQSTGTDMSQEPHIYSVEWDEHKIIWRVDGTEVLKKYRWFNLQGQEMLLCGQIPPAFYSKDRMYPFDNEPMNIITSFNVDVNSTATFPVEMEIDYIRVYQRINSSSSVNICAQTDIKGSTMAGQEIIIGGTNCSNITIEAGEYLTLAAKEKIAILSDFKVESGALFSLKIDN